MPAEMRGTGGGVTLVAMCAPLRGFGLARFNAPTLWLVKVPHTTPTPHVCRMC